VVIAAEVPRTITCLEETRKLAAVLSDKPVYVLLVSQYPFRLLIGPRLILPKLLSLDKGVHLKIEPLPHDFKLVMETALGLALHPLCAIMH
jgi:hypothetical protein